MSEDDTLPTVPAAENAEPAESETSEATTEVNETEEGAETETETEPDPDKDEDGGEDDDGDKPKRPSRYQRLKRERDALAARLAMQESRPLAAAAGDPAALEKLVRDEIGEPPKESDYPDDWFAYERAQTAYETDKRSVTRDIRRRAQEAERAARQVHEERSQEHAERQQEARKRIPDFDRVVSAAANAPAANYVIELLLESEKGAVLQYHLAKNPDVLERLNAIGPLGAAKEIARLEDRLSLPNPKATKAAAPLSVPKGGATPGPDLSKMSMDDYVAFRKRASA